MGHRHNAKSISSKYHTPRRSGKHSYWHKNTWRRKQVLYSKWKSDIPDKNLPADEITQSSTPVKEKKYCILKKNHSRTPILEKTIIVTYNIIRIGIQKPQLSDEPDKPRTMSCKTNLRTI